MTKSSPHSWLSCQTYKTCHFHCLVCTARTKESTQHMDDGPCQVFLPALGLSRTFSDSSRAKFWPGKVYSFRQIGSGVCRLSIHNKRINIQWTSLGWDVPSSGPACLARPARLARPDKPATSTSSHNNVEAYYCWLITMLECKLCSLSAELLLLRVGWGGEGKCKIKAKLSPSFSWAEFSLNLTLLLPTPPPEKVVI